MVDYQKCRPERCDHGICLAALEYGNLMQLSSYQAPEINPAKWCHGRAKCYVARPLKVIRML